ncbi:MAG TPA: hypothetical protein VN873_15700 [Candidatus Angelobacter sp.]|nr:hypothetical protein [Candidatus Angelobacter sp.]
MEVSATDKELLDVARELVTRSPQQAIAWARSQSDATLRARLLHAVVQAWGEIQPAIAVDWAMSQNDSERQLDLDAALAGAVKQPEAALAIVRGLLKYDPTDSAGSVPAFVVALNNAGQFQIAVEFLKDAPANARADWMAATFRRWGGSQPQEAVKALALLEDPKLRHAAFHSLADGWSANDPAGLASYASSLPEGHDRTDAIEKAVDSWSLQDPPALANWLNTSPNGVDFDRAVAELISKTDGANRSPELAMAWVERISDPAMQSNSVAIVLKQWSRSDPAAAQNYVANAAWMDEQSRGEFLKVLQGEASAPKEF